MKYLILIIEGSAEPVPADANTRTALEKADLPNLADLAALGRIGTAAFIPDGCRPDEEIALVSAFGVEPLNAGITRGVLDALALGLTIEPGSVVASLELITVVDRDADGAGEIVEQVTIPEPEASNLFKSVEGFWRSSERNISVHHCGGLRAVMIESGGHYYRGVQTEAAVMGESFEDLLPAGGIPGDADALAALVRTSHDFLRQHEVNLTRIEQGLLPANLVWVTQPSPVPRVRSFKDRTKLMGCVISRRCPAIGLARLLEMDYDNVNDGTLAAVAREALNAIESHDLVMVRIGADSIEAVDAEIIGPLFKRLLKEGESEGRPTGESPAGSQRGWRMLVMPTRVMDSRGQFHNDPVPFVMAGDWVRSAVVRQWTEREAEASDLHVQHGHELLEYFLFGGLKRRPGNRQKRRLME